MNKSSPGPPTLSGRAGGLNSPVFSARGFVVRGKGDDGMGLFFLFFLFFFEGQMTQKVFVTHYEAQIPLVVYRRGCNVINPSKSEHQEFLVRKGLLIGQIGFFSFPNTGVTWRVVRVPPPPTPAFACWEC